MMIVSTDDRFLKPAPTDMLPLRIRRFFYGLDTDGISEIRLRAGGVVCVNTVFGKRFLTRGGKLSEKCDNAVTVTVRDIEEATEILTSSSLYSYRDDIKNGFITARGGHRVGICGKMTEDCSFVTGITGLNYRFAREIKGCADCVSDKVYNGGNIKNTLIVSSPGCGKTTFLRDLIRQISDKGANVSVVDERGEIAAMHSGIPGFDIGINTDVFDMCPKEVGMKLMIRSMSPEVIAVDELGGREDAEALQLAAKSGVSVFATMHCRSWKEDIPASLLENFKCIIQLSDKPRPGIVREAVYV